MPESAQIGGWAASGLEVGVRVHVAGDDVVQGVKGLIGLPVDNSIAFGEYDLRVQQQSRAVDKLLASIDKALTSARQMRN